MCDRIKAAQALAGAADEHARELHGNAHPEIAEIEELAGDHEAAAERLRLYCDFLAEHGRTAALSTYASWFGRTLCALVRAQRGDHAEAEQLAREAVALTQTTDSPKIQGDALSGPERR
jgi:hypothetical protein